MGVVEGTRRAGGRGVGGRSRSREAAPEIAGCPARDCSCLAAGEVALALRDVCLQSRGHGGVAAAASRDDCSPQPEPKAAAAATTAVPAASPGSAGLGGRGEAPNP